MSQIVANVKLFLKHGAETRVGLILLFKCFKHDPLTVFLGRVDIIEIFVPFR